MHTLLDLRGDIPSFIHVSTGKMHEVNSLDLLTLERCAFYLMDRGYLNFARLHRMHEVGSFFVTRSKRTLDLHFGAGDIALHFRENAHF